MIKKVKIQGYRTFNDFTITPVKGFNLIVGANESGKSTLLEAVSIALTGRLNGRTAAEELTPYWFNVATVKQFLAQRAEGRNVGWPEIRIELFFEDRSELQELCGAHNSDVPTTAVPGVSLRVVPNPDYSSYREEWLKTDSQLLPVEYYDVEWRSFADAPLGVRPRCLSVAVIDSRTIRGGSGVDYHMRQMVNDQLDPAERAAISVAYRDLRGEMSKRNLEALNAKIATTKASLSDKPITLALDQSARASWEAALVPHVGDVPFSMSGLGQQAAIKISLAMSRQASRASVVLVEEPENHLSHTSLAMLLRRLSDLAADEQQVFVATHSSYVLNRLGVDRLYLVGGESPRRLTDLREETTSYFQKLPGYDTLRMVLADRVVLVEGPSDEIVFERVFKDRHGRRPIECGVDVISIRGLAFGRCLELCAVLGKAVAAIRDNDGRAPEELHEEYQAWLSDGRRELFIGEPAHGRTLEPQLVHCNGEQIMREVLQISPDADVEKWMTREKTETALRFAQADRVVTGPNYMIRAAEFINGE